MVQSIAPPFYRLMGTKLPIRSDLSAKMLAKIYKKHKCWGIYGERSLKRGFLCKNGQNSDKMIQKMFVISENYRESPQNVRFLCKMFLDYAGLRRIAP